MLPLHVYMLSHFSCFQLFATLWTVAHQAPLSKGFSRQESQNELPCPPPGALRDPGIKPVSLTFSVLAGMLFVSVTTWEAPAGLFKMQNLRSHSRSTESEPTF